MSRSRDKFGEDSNPHSLACAIVNWLPLFASPAIVSILAESLTFLRLNRDVKIHAYAIMENHLHLVAAGEELSEKIGQFKSFTAHQIINYFEERNARTTLKLLMLSKADYKKDQKYQVWQEGSHPQQLDTEAMITQKIEYIHNNPLKRGYVGDPEHWLYSSARNYAGLDSLIEIDQQW